MKRKPYENEMDARHGFGEPTGLSQVPAPCDCSAALETVQAAVEALWGDCGNRDRTEQDLVLCADCKRMVPRLEASEQVTHERRKVRCIQCGDKAFIRALRLHNSDTPNKQLTRNQTS